MPETTDTMGLAQLINMLNAAYAQGARRVRVARREDPAYGSASQVEWVGLRPVDGVVYIGATGQWEFMDNHALESLDW